MLKTSVVILKALADEVRLRIFLLLKDDSLCVCEIENSLKMSQPRISQHLLKLKNTSLIDDKQVGKWKYYFITRDGKKFLDKTLLQLMESLKKDSTAKSDMKNLINFKSSRGCK